MNKNVSKLKAMTNFGFAGEQVNPGLLKTVHFARNGIFETKKGSWMGSCTLKTSNYVLNPSKLVEEMKETYSLNEMEYKLPLKGFAAIYHFYKYVTDLNGNEAQINFYINEKDLKEITIDDEIKVIKDIPGVHYWNEKVFSYVPIQDNGGARTSTKDEIYHEFRRVMKPFIETHSHNTMGAFKSGTDKANSDIEGLQIVLGKLDNPEKYDFQSWATISGNQFDTVPYEEMSKFINLPKTIGEVEELNNYELPVDLLDEWLNQCNFSSGYMGYSNQYNSYKKVTETYTYEEETYVNPPYTPSSKGYNKNSNVKNFNKKNSNKGKKNKSKEEKKLTKVDKNPSSKPKNTSVNAISTKENISINENKDVSMINTSKVDISKKEKLTIENPVKNSNNDKYFIRKFKQVIELFSSNKNK